MIIVYPEIVFYMDGQKIVSKKEHLSVVEIRRLTGVGFMHQIFLGDSPIHGSALHDSDTIWVYNRSFISVPPTTW